jgi:hypothetical protein
LRLARATAEGTCGPGDPITSPSRADRRSDRDIHLMIALK